MVSGKVYYSKARWIYLCAPRVCRTYFQKRPNEILENLIMEVRERSFRIRQGIVHTEVGMIGLLA